MRRRRPQLQVSLFPFLSVLLCMLGALILLLLVLDQRARHARSQEAQAHWRDAEQAAHAVQARLEAELQERLDALRTRRAALRQQIDAKAAAETSAQAKRMIQETNLAALQRLLDAELARADEMQAAARQKAAQAHTLTEQRTAREAALARLLEQLRTLEQLVQRLQEAVRNRRPLYSLVPYRGQQGTRRQPLYLECVDNRVVFRPDGERLSLVQAQLPGRVLDAIEQRSKLLPKTEENEKPYVLLLVRPSGMSLYYVIVRALHKANVDIGYEFLDESWVLDFSSPASDAVAGAGGENRERESGIENRDSGSRNQGSRIGTEGWKRGGPGSESQGGLVAGSGSGSINELNVGSGTGAGKPGGGTGRSEAQETNSAKPGEKAVGAAAAVSPGGLSGPKTGGGGPVTLLPPAPTRPPGAQPQVASGQREGSTGREKGSSAQRPETNNSTKRRPEGPGERDEGKGRLPHTETRPTDGPPTREWQIVIECRADSVVLERMNQRFELSKLSGQGNPLAAAVADLVIKKRQRLPDVRPEIKFLIRPEGLRAYYAAAAALEPLALPAKWEVVRE